MYSVLGKYMYYCAIMFGPIFTHVRFLSSVQYPVPDYYGQKKRAFIKADILWTTLLKFTKVKNDLGVVL